MTKKKEQVKTSEVKVEQGGSELSLKIAWYAILGLLIWLAAYNKMTGSESDDETAETVASAPDFDLSNWLDGYYQDKTEAYLKNDSRLGKKLLPVKNQLDYELYKKLSLYAYVVGKDDYFICTDAVNTYLGKNALPDSTVNDQLTKAKVIADTLKAKGIDLILAYVPTKEYFMPETVVPTKYLKFPKQVNNYEKFVNKSKALGLNFIDYYSYLNSIKNTAPYPLFTQHGTHWSYYTECIAADTMLRYIEHLKGIELPMLSWKDVTLSDVPKVRDGDAIGKSALEHVGPERKPLAYPNIGYTGSPAATPIKVLGIGDSYYRGYAYLGLMEVPFDKSEYWYYNNSVVPETPDKKEVWEYDLKSQLESYKAIIIMYCSNNLDHFGDGFIDDAYQMYTNPGAYYARVKKERPIKMAKKTIHQDADMMEEIQKKASRLNISIDSAINLKAIEMASGAKG
ncbi:MAG: hypothetical protein JST70_16575 [Bacteroidetes bacterium]|nr:hypothetical protein [Bacteroidota bacterium]